MANRGIVLRTGADFTRDDVEWKFTYPSNQLATRSQKGNPLGKLITFTKESITLSTTPLPMNRMLYNENPADFVLASFGSLSFENAFMSVKAEYMKRFFAAGLFLNGVQYRFYGHSNSQLKSGSCFLRAANADDELDKKINSLGEFGKVMSVAKRAKRIGLLFSTAEIDYDLDPKWTKDIPDIKIGDEIFSDGCGLVALRLAQQLSKSKKIIFRGKKYTPSVYQIRYKGYKGVLMLHPMLDKQKSTSLVHFRSSMKKFNTTISNTFSIVGYSGPYSFGRLNSDIVVLLSALGVSNESLLKKQERYFTWIKDARTDIPSAVNLLAAMGKPDLAERVLLEGLDAPGIQSTIASFQKKEIADFKKGNTERERVRMFIPKSRLLYGVCDPYGVLKPGEVHVRITTDSGPTTLYAVDLMVIRNPCLHPGDLLKLRAANPPAVDPMVTMPPQPALPYPVTATAPPALSHLVDCIVFASQGKRAAPSMSSGGDLDGDKFFVCWDPDIVPSTIAESYDYPAPKERMSTSVTRADLANYFASYNNASLARVSSLHRKWAMLKGAMSPECQELNALHSQSVDGAKIRIPERLLAPPTPAEPFVLELLAAQAQAFAAEFLAGPGREEPASAPSANASLESEEMHETLIRLLTADEPDLAFTEGELVQIVLQACRRSRQMDAQGNYRTPLEPRNYLPYIDFGALSALEKHALSVSLDLSLYEPNSPYMWNSLFQSDILTARDLISHELNRPLRLQRFYSSFHQGRAAFFEYLQLAMQDFTRKFVILKTDDRFAIGLFIRGRYIWGEDLHVGENVVACSFQATAAEAKLTYRPMTREHRLHCSDSLFQLYNTQRANTFVYLARHPQPERSGIDLITSIALQNISAVVQQLGRVLRQPVVAIEIHVVSHRDRQAQQLFDLRFSHVETEEVLPRFTREELTYTRATLKTVDWDQVSPLVGRVFPKTRMSEIPAILRSLGDDDVSTLMEFSIMHRADSHTYSIFDTMTSSDDPNLPAIAHSMDLIPPLAFVLLKRHLPNTSTVLPSPFSAILTTVVKNIIRSANLVGISTLVGLEKLKDSIAQLPIQSFLDIAWLASLCVRPFQLAHETLIVLWECREAVINSSALMEYVHKHALNVACDRAEEAAESCPCDEVGVPTRQRNAPIAVRLKHVLIKVDKDDPDPPPPPPFPTEVMVHVRVDRMTTIRLGSHIRLRAASESENSAPPTTIERRPIVDAVVVQSGKGELRVELLHHLPPEFEAMGWLMYDAGSVTTSKAMMDALAKLAVDQWEACQLIGIVAGADPSTVQYALRQDLASEDNLGGFNESQKTAIRSAHYPMSLIWGPPGTGKTTVVVEMISRIVRSLEEGSKLLITASTHNAVDNVLERFADKRVLSDQQILRVATDNSKVHAQLQKFTIDARVGGSVTDNPRLLKEAEKRVKDALVVFTTCSGSGLGILRKFDFDIVVIDEASQVTEPCALIPLVKGCKQAILVGDHVQLRPTVRPLGKALEFDKSLLERLYTSQDITSTGLTRTMLDVQYRFPEALAAFPSKMFYDGKLKTGKPYSLKDDDRLSASSFPWPRDERGRIVPNVFVQCSAEEDYGRSSKSNTGQVDLVERIVKLLAPVAVSEENTLEIVALSPYSRQVKAMRDRLSQITASTIDGFQGREADVVVYSTVRSNAEGDIGFLDDRRRLNVAWTRPKMGRIIVGDRATLERNDELWKAAIHDCVEVKVD